MRSAPGSQFEMLHGLGFRFQSGSGFNDNDLRRRFQVNPKPLSISGPPLKP